MVTVVYSAQERDFEPGFVYRNPKFFQKPLGKPDSVVVVGNWPNVESAYRAIGCKVTVVAPGAPLREPGTVPAPQRPGSGNRAPIDPPQGDNAVTIPDNWRDLPWVPRDGGMSIRSLAASLTDEPIRKTADAVAAIEAYLAKRG